MASNGPIRMLLVGDIAARKYPGGLRHMLEKSRPELKRGDIVFGNLEFAITDKGSSDPSKDWTTGRRMEPEEATALGEAGIRVMSLANNHAMDFGPEGLLQTIELLESQNIAHCGGGRNLSEARRPAVLERNGVRIAFLAYTSVFAPSFPATNDRAGMATVGINVSFMPHRRTFEAPGTPPIVITSAKEADLDAMRVDVQKAKADADVVVVSWHWGVSLAGTDAAAGSRRKRVSYQMECGRAAIDAGASLVVGHHPHGLQGVEVYKKGTIFYSVGNFAFWSGELKKAESHDKNAVMVDCEISMDGIQAVTVRPILINSEGQPELVQGRDGTRGLANLVGDSVELGTKFHDEGDILRLVPGE